MKLFVGNLFTMAITYQYDPAKNIVNTHYEGTITEQDYAPHFAKVLNDSNLQPGWISIIDVSSAANIEIDFMNAQGILTEEVIEKMKETGYAGAVFLADNPNKFGMSRVIMSGAAVRDNYFDNRYKVTSNKEEVSDLVDELREAWNAKYK